MSKAFMTMMMMAMAVFHFAEGARIKSPGVEALLGNSIEAMKDGVDEAFEKKAAANPQLQCCLEGMMEDPSLQKMMALVQKQMEAESPSLLEVGESSGEEAKVVPWKVMAAALLMMSNLSPSLAFDVAQVKQAVRFNAPAISKAQLNKAVEAAMPVIAAAVLTTGALPASAGDAGAGEQIFSGNCAAMPVRASKSSRAIA